MIKVGLIGCGFMGGMHAACYAALADLDVKVTAVADVRPEFAAKLDALNESGISSSHAGFVFDPNPVSSEIAACENVLAQYTGQLTYPAFKDPTAFVEEFRSELKANGMDKIIEEAQRQLDAWHEVNG